MLDLAGCVVQMRGEADVACAKSGVDAGLCQALVDRLIFIGISSADDDYRRPPVGAGGADEAVPAVLEQSDELFDERLVVAGNRLDVLSQEILQRRGPEDEVEKVGGAEDVVSPGTQIVAQAMLAFSAEVEFDAVGQGKPVGLDGVHHLQDVGADPGKASAVGAAQPFEA